MCISTPIYLALAINYYTILYVSYYTILYVSYKSTLFLGWCNYHFVEKHKSKKILPLQRHVSVMVHALLSGTYRDMSFFAEIIASEYGGQYVMLPKIALSSQDSALPINFARCQFPVRLAYCLTNNNAQGQSLRYVDIYFPKPVFSHGQLHVAVSRVKSFSGLKVFTSHGRLTKNVVYRKVLS